MSKIHKKKTVRYFVLALALVFVCCTFSLTAFAVEDVTPTSSKSSPQIANDAGTSSSTSSTKPTTTSTKPTTTSTKPSTTSTKPSTTSTKPSTTTTKPRSKVSSTAPKKSTLSGNYDSQASVTSEDWKQVLSSANSSEVSALASSEVSSAAPVQASDGGVSWMLILGIILVVLGLGGIGFFIYIQFINKQETLEDITAQAKRQVKRPKSSAPRPRRK